jgi:hypothetical protein
MTRINKLKRFCTGAALAVYLLWESVTPGSTAFSFDNERIWMGSCPICERDLYRKEPDPHCTHFEFYQDWLEYRATVMMSGTAEEWERILDADKAIAKHFDPRTLDGRISVGWGIPAGEDGLDE